MGRGFACCGCAFCATSDGQALSAKKKTTIQALDAIKNFYYERYKKYGLDKIESWS